MAALHGYHGRYLRIEGCGATRGALLPLEEAALREYVGGVGLGAWILAREMPLGVEALSASGALVFAFSPLVGSPLTTSAKFAVVGKSPLTHRLCDALSSSHFALAGKRAGVDAIVIRGTWRAPVALLVDGLGRSEPLVTEYDARALWGRKASEAEQELRAQLGPEWQVAAIGPAGEARIPFATISHDGRHAGRGGLGAVLGAKGVKAIAVRGDRRTPLADPERTVALARSLSERSFGPATEKYRELGTVANLLVFNRLGTLPTRNFAAGQFEGAERLVPENLAPARKLARNSCAACTIGCEHIYAIQSVSGPSVGARMEYESLYALGPLCGVGDADVVLRAAARCDEWGIDTISTGGTIAFVMDCGARGWLDATLPSGRTLCFGEGEALLEAIDALVERRGLGEMLALGSRAAAAQLGGSASSRAMHVKGLELPGYDPRRLHAMALGLAVGTRGADHNRSGAYEVDFSNAADRRAGGATTAELAVETEDRAAVMDSLILCKFVRGVFADFYGECAELLEAVTGCATTAGDLRATAKRIVGLRKAINQGMGWTREEDTLPAGLLDDRLCDEAEGSGLSRARLERMIAAYYRARGWDAEGRTAACVPSVCELSTSEARDP